LSFFLFSSAPSLFFLPLGSSAGVMRNGDQFLVFFSPSFPLFFPQSSIRLSSLLSSRSRERRDLSFSPFFRETDPSFPPPFSSPLLDPVDDELKGQRPQPPFSVAAFFLFFFSVLRCTTRSESKRRRSNDDPILLPFPFFSFFRALFQPVTVI